MPDFSIDIEVLIAGYLQQTLTEDEGRALDRWVKDSQVNEEFFEKISNEEYFSSELARLYSYDEEKGWKSIKEKYSFAQSAHVRRINWRRWVAAAAILVLIGSSSYFLFLDKKGNNDLAKKENEPKDFAAPASTKAIIILADGRKIPMDSLNKGMLTTQGNVTITKNADGQVVYNGTAAEMAYNSVINPRGSQVQQLTLSDGTKIWLNAESSVRFPAAFAGSERKVEITGEAYFEVSHNAAKPFIVKDSYRNTTVEVLGTHFNVNAYTNENSVDVTLLEGAVKVARENLKAMLNPGEQAKVTDKVTVLDNVDMQAVMAWKNGYFNFSRVDIKTLMRQIARWYDVEVEYEGLTSKERFGGEVPRNSNLSQVMEILRTSGVRFSIEGRKVIIRS